MADMTTCKIPLLDLKGPALVRELGMLELQLAAGKVTLPLKTVNIKARVAEQVAEATIEQVFQNTCTEHIEAVYIFPLAGGSVVTSFELQVKDRIIRGIVEERAEARKQYQQALDEGKRAALLEKERDDVFTVQVGNLPPGEDVTVRLTYSERLPFFEDGTTELRLPLVVAPRYIPGSPLDREQVGHGTADDTDEVPDASRITPPLLAPGVDPKTALGIRVELLPGVSRNSSDSLSNLQCSQHAVQTSEEDGSISIELSREDERLNRDFVLRWRLSQKTMRSSLLVCRENDEEPWYGMLSLIPPHREGFLGMARDVVFVLDRSGSMQGPKMASASRACSHLLATLEPRDRFAILAFDDSLEWFTPAGNTRFIHADEAGLEKGNKFLRSIDARGGTELDNALSDALKAIGGRMAGNSMPIIVLLTDGQIGDESMVMKRIQKEIGDTRVFTVGIDTAVNEGFLKRLASLGGGTSCFVTPGENLEQALLAIGREIGAPVMVDISIEGVDAGLDKDSMAPERIPDLFAGRSATVFFTMKKEGQVRIRGRLAQGDAWAEVVLSGHIDLPAIAHLWARTRIADLEDRFRISPSDTIKKEIITLSKKHSILTRFTSFVVVDESEIVNRDGKMRTIVQPVEKPDRWEMEMDGMSAGRSRMACGAAPMPRAFKAAMAPEIMASLAPPAPAGGMAPPPPPMQSIARKPMKQKSIFKKEQREEFEAMPMEQGPPMPSICSEGPVAESMPAAKADASKIPAIEDAFDKLEKALKEALDSLKSGKVPASKELEKARTVLMKVLADHDLSADLPLIQRFLRVSAVEMVAALSTGGIDPSSLMDLFERHMEIFRKARAEAVQMRLVRKPGAGPDPAPYWESTI